MKQAMAGTYLVGKAEKRDSGLLGSIPCSASHSLCDLTSLPPPLETPALSRPPL